MRNTTKKKLKLLPRPVAKVRLLLQRTWRVAEQILFLAVTRSLWRAQNQATTLKHLKSRWRNLKVFEKIMGMLNIPEDEAIESRMVSRAVEGAQRKVEGHNFDMRKHLLEYDDVM